MKISQEPGWQTSHSHSLARQPKSRSPGSCSFVNRRTSRTLRSPGLGFLVSCAGIRGLGGKGNRLTFPRACVHRRAAPSTVSVRGEGPFSRGRKAHPTSERGSMLGCDSVGLCLVRSSRTKGAGPVKSLPPPSERIFPRDAAARFPCHNLRPRGQTRLLLHKKASLNVTRECDPTTSTGKGVSISSASVRGAGVSRKRGSFPTSGCTVRRKISTGLGLQGGHTGGVGLPGIPLSPPVLVCLVVFLPA
jgi:hypothetical protein